MSQESSAQVAQQPRALLFMVFFCSGATGLVDQTVWMRMLVRAFGGTVQATATIVAVFMGGLAIGAAVAARLFRARMRSPRWYGFLEMAIGAAVALATVGMHFVPSTFAWLAGGTDAPTALVVVLRIALTAVVLAIPTILMGMTLPLITVILERDDKQSFTLGLLYAVNTIGAVVGVFLTGFVLLDCLGETASIAASVTTNLLLGLAVLRWGRSAPSTEVLTDVQTPPRPLSLDRRALAVAGMAGFIALGLEVVWTRQLVLVLGSSVYAFATMLGACLVGIGVGSLAIAPWIERFQRLERALAGLLSAWVITLSLSMVVFAQIGLYLDDDKYMYSPLSKGIDAAWFIVIGMAVVFPVTFVQGAIFPLIVRLAVPQKQMVSRGVGIIYAVNTIFGVIGSLVSGFIFLPTLGAQGTFYGLTIVVLLFSLLIFLRSRDRPSLAFAVAAAIVFVALMPGELVGQQILMNRIGKYFGASAQLHRYLDEADSTVAIIGTGERRHLFINGIIVSSHGGAGELMADMPLAMIDRPQSALVICHGVGDAFRTAVDHLAPFGGHVDLVEIAAGVLKVADASDPRGLEYLARPDVGAYVNDGRNHLLVSRKQYDLVIVDAAPPIYSAGAVNLYTREFVDLVREHLTERGIYMLWIPLPAFPEDFWGITRNLVEAFPHTVAWGARGSGIMVLGSKSPLHLDIDAVMNTLRARSRLPSWMTRELLQEGMLISPEDLRARALTYPAVTDDRPRTEFPLSRLLAGEPRVGVASIMLGGSATPR